MSYSTLQKDLEHITLKKDLDQALERMVEFEKEVNAKMKNLNLKKKKNLKKKNLKKKNLKKNSKHIILFK